MVQSSASCNRSARSRSSSSLPRRATSCAPTGTPPSENPAGTESDGWRERLNGAASGPSSRWPGLLPRGHAGWNVEGVSSRSKSSHHSASGAIAYVDLRTGGSHLRVRSGGGAAPQRRTRCPRARLAARDGRGDRLSTRSPGDELHHWRSRGTRRRHARGDRARVASRARRGGRATRAADRRDGCLRRTMGRS